MHSRAFAQIIRFSSVGLLFRVTFCGKNLEQTPSPELTAVIKPYNDGFVVIPPKNLRQGKVYKNEAWIKELRRPVLKSLNQGMMRFSKTVGRIPAYATQPWVQEIEKKMDAALCKALNIKNDDEINPAICGVLSAQAENCSKMDFKPLLKAKSLSPQVERNFKKVFSMVGPMQRALGRVSKKIDQVMRRQPASLQLIFLLARERALKKKMYQEPNPIFWETSATRLYMLLLFLAPWMREIQSVQHLHDILRRIAPGIVGHDIKRLAKTCQRIQLKFRTPGRPRNAAV